MFRRNPGDMNDSKPGLALPKLCKTSWQRADELASEVLAACKDLDLLQRGSRGPEAEEERERERRESDGGAPARPTPESRARATTSRGERPRSNHGDTPRGRRHAGIIEPGRASDRRPSFFARARRTIRSRGPRRRDVVRRFIRRGAQDDATWYGDLLLPRP